jgi:two-component system cell cycle response regulator DivK
LVLIVEDADDVRELVRFVLDTSGYRVLVAIDGEEAVRLAWTERPDLIVMDLNLPVLDGFGAARGIRRIVEMADVPIIAISAHNTRDHRAKAFDVGFDDFLTKPIDFVHLVNLIHSLLETA